MSICNYDNLFICHSIIQCKEYQYCAVNQVLWFLLLLCPNRINRARTLINFGEKTYPGNLHFSHPVYWNLKDFPITPCRGKYQWDVYKPQLEVSDYINDSTTGKTNEKTTKRNFRSLEENLRKFDKW